MATAGKLILLDARPPGRAFGPEQQREALDKLERKAGAAVAAVEAAVSEAFGHLRAELNQLAGGQASARVMIMARNAELAQMAAELQASISRGAVGGYIEIPDEGHAEKGLRSLAGICAVANDLLAKTYDAAREEAKEKKGGLTGQLLDRIGVASPGSPETHGSAATRVDSDPVGLDPAFDPRGGSVVGPPQSPSSPSPKEPK